MALNIQTGSLTQPVGTGNQTTNLAADFDPKAIIFWATPVAADGIVAHGSFSWGFATYRGSTVAQRYIVVFAEDNQATSDTYRAYSNDAVLRLLDGTGAVDFLLTFISFATGASSAFTVNFGNLHTTASIKINYMVFGGSDVEDALVSNFDQTNSTGDQDVTVVAGFGQPSIVFMHSDTVDGHTTVVADGDMSLGFGVKSGSGNGRAIYWASDDAAATESTGQAIFNNVAMSRDAAPGGSPESTFTLAASSGWPTDGFRINKTVAGFTATIDYLAIKFSSNVTLTTGENTIRTSTGQTTLSGAASTTAKGLMLFNMRTATSNTYDTTSADSAMGGIGAVDASGNEIWAGLWDDDGQATASVASSAWSNTKVIRYYDPSADTLTSEADGSLSGADAIIDVTDADASAFLYEWLIFAVASTATFIAQPNKPILQAINRSNTY